MPWSKTPALREFVELGKGRLEPVQFAFATYSGKAISVNITYQAASRMSEDTWACKPLDEPHGDQGVAVLMLPALRSRSRAVHMA